MSVLELTIQHYKTYAARLSLMTATAVLLASCASTQRADRHPQDPLEPFNREMYSLNKGLYTIFFKSVAGVYAKVTPPQVRRGVTNFFSNINDINVAANQILQFKVEDAIKTSVRFLINTTMGIGGLFDVATHSGLYKTREDFGTTLAFYGMKESPYLVLPLLGPSTMRDSAGLIVDYYLSPWAYIDFDTALIAYSINLLNQRANLLDEVYYVDYAAMDDYTFVREIYLKRRDALINDEQSIDSWDAEEDKWADWAVEWSEEVAPGVEAQVQPALGTAPE